MPKRPTQNRNILKLNKERNASPDAETKLEAKDTVPDRGDFLARGDKAVLVCPIDEAAPRGRLILPQQQTIRDILDSDAIALVAKETDLAETLSSLRVPLTTFSILMARYKGFFPDIHSLIS